QWILERRRRMAQIDAAWRPLVLGYWLVGVAAAGWVCAQIPRDAGCFGYVMALVPFGLLYFGHEFIQSRIQKARSDASWEIGKKFLRQDPADAGRDEQVGGAAPGPTQDSYL